MSIIVPSPYLSGFNPRAHAERDTPTPCLWRWRYSCFKPTRSRGARPRERGAAHTDHAGFNPRAHAERDGGAGCGNRPGAAVSTHALTRSATCRRFCTRV